MTSDPTSMALSASAATGDDVRLLAEGVDALADQTTIALLQAEEATDRRLREQAEICSACDSILARDLAALRRRARQVIISGSALIALALTPIAADLIQAVTR